MATPSNQIIVTTVCFVMIVIAMVVVYMFSKPPAKEGYANNATLPLYEYNNLMASSKCMRNLEFSNFATAKYNVSQRATVSDKSRASCSLSLTDEKLADEYSIIEENNISYGIQMMCMQVRFNAVYLTTNPEHIVFTFLNETYDDIKNLMNIYLSNPIYFEFEGSSPYVPVYAASNSYLRNSSDVFIFPDEKTGKTVQCAFRKLVDRKDSANEAFKYTKQKEPIETLKGALMDKSDSIKYVDLKMYYLEPKDAQTSGIIRPLSHLYQTSQTISSMKIYNKNYVAALDKARDEFFFNQKIFIMLQNTNLPIFTFTFTINVPTLSYRSLLDKQTEILKVAMDTKVLGDQACGERFTALEGKGAGNIMSCTIYSVNLRQQSFVLNLQTPSMSASGLCSFPENSALRVELPFVDDIQTIKVIATVSPYNKMCLCKWRKNGMDTFVFKRTTVCDTNNSFLEVFSKKSSGSTIINEDINLMYHTTYVKDVKRVQLGHVHYMDDVYDV